MTDSPMPFTAPNPKRISFDSGLALNESVDSLIFGGRTLILSLCHSLIITLNFAVLPDFAVRTAVRNSTG